MLHEVSPGSACGGKYSEGSADFRVESAPGLEGPGGMASGR